MLCTPTDVGAVGRLTKKFWSEVKSYPPSFKALRITFNEASTCMHSWAIDYLESLSAFLSNAPPLEEVVVSRMVPKEAQLPFMHNTVSMSPFLASKCIPMGLTAQLLKHADTLRKLDITYWEVPLEAVKAILDSCGRVRDLSLLLDAPFAKLVSVQRPVQRNQAELVGAVKSQCIAGFGAASAKAADQYTTSTHSCSQPRKFHYNHAHQELHRVSRICRVYHAAGIRCRA